MSARGRAGHRHRPERGDEVGHLGRVGADRGTQPPPDDALEPAGRTAVDVGGQRQRARPRSQSPGPALVEAKDALAPGTHRGVGDDERAPGGPARLREAGPRRASGRSASRRGGAIAARPWTASGATGARSGRPPWGTSQEVVATGDGRPGPRHGGLQALVLTGPAPPARAGGPSAHARPRREPYGARSRATELTGGAPGGRGPAGTVGLRDPHRPARRLVPPRFGPEVIGGAEIVAGRGGRRPGRSGLGGRGPHHLRPRPLHLGQRVPAGRRRSDGDLHRPPLPDRGRHRPGRAGRPRGPHPRRRAADPRPSSSGG